MSDHATFFKNLWEALTTPPELAADGTRVSLRIAAISREQFDYLIELGFKEEYEKHGCGGGQTRPKIVLTRIEVYPEDVVQTILPEDVRTS